MFKVHLFIRRMNGMIAHDDLPRYTDNDRIGRRRSDHYCVRSNATVVPNHDRSQHLGPCANDHMIADSRVTFDLVQTCAAQCDSVIDGDIVPDFSCLADNHAHAMIDEEVMPDRRTWMDFNTGEPAHDLRNRACDQFETTLPQTVRQAMCPNGVQPWVA